MTFPTNPSSIIAISTPLRRRPTFVGLISASEYTAIAVAPILGGVLTSNLSWRWCFFINLPAAALPSAILLLLQLPNITPRGSKTHIQKLRELDLLGFFLFAPAVLCLLLALQWGGDTYSWTNGRIISLLVLSPIIFAGFCLLQHRKQDRAMLPPRVLRKRVIITGSVFSLCLSACRAIVQYYVCSLPSLQNHTNPPSSSPSGSKPSATPVPSKVASTPSR